MRPSQRICILAAASYQHERRTMGADEQPANSVGDSLGFERRRRRVCKVAGAGCTLRVCGTNKTAAAASNRRKLCTLGLRPGPLVDLTLVVTHQQCCAELCSASESAVSR
jgi:hypothetical protein